MNKDALHGFLWALLWATLITWVFIPWQYGGMYLLGQYLGYV